MRTRTIYKARIKAGLRYVNEYPGPCARQLATFEAELLRRMDERDALVARLASANDKIADLENEAYHQMEMLDG